MGNIIRSYWPKFIHFILPFTADWEDTRVDQYGDILTGGTIEVFENEATLVKRKEYLEPFLEEAMFLQYMFIHKNVIVRVDKELTPSQAEEYKDVLESL